MAEDPLADFGMLEDAPTLLSSTNFHRAAKPKANSTDGVVFNSLLSHLEPGFLQGVRYDLLAEIMQ